jgi:SRSO17 transposase
MIRPGGPKAGVPETIHFETKTAIALRQLRQALAAGVPVGILLGDPAYGDETDFRVGVTDLGLRYVLGVRSGTSVWAPGTGPLPAPDPAAARCGASAGDAQGAGLEPACPHLAQGHLARGNAGQAVLALRRRAVRPAHRDMQRSEPWPEEWLLIEWPEGEAEPAKYWFSNLPRRTSLKRLVRIAKARWWIERDYQDLKPELGLGHDEGRNWRGFHHHASLCIAAYGFLIAERCLFPPRQQFIRRRIETSVLPADFQPRGAADAP